MIPATLTLSLMAALSPPVEFDVQVLPFRVERPSFIEVQEICKGTYGPDQVSMGCADTYGRVAYIPIEFEGELYDLIFRHERAHMNGWVH